MSPEAKRCSTGTCAFRIAARRGRGEDASEVQDHSKSAGSRTGLADLGHGGHTRP
jgi:hypothetical protein